MNPSPELDELALRLGHRFSDPSRLEHALTHRSWCAENEGYESNERLEFLGDAVLGLVVTDHIFKSHPHLAEGELAKIRASVVSSVALAEVAAELGVGAHLLLGKGELSSGGAEKASILADALEAIIGAIYLDGGVEPALKLVLSAFDERISVSVDGPGGDDYKTKLQEMAVRRFTALPVYTIQSNGPDHAKEFEAVVSVAGIPRGRGVGRSKKQAEQMAAAEAWANVVAAETDSTHFHDADGQGPQ